MEGKWFLQMEGDEEETTFFIYNQTMVVYGEQPRFGKVLPSTDHNFPATDFWFMADFPNWEDGYTHWNFLKFASDGSLIVHHFCKSNDSRCHGEYGPGIQNYCCPGKATRHPRQGEKFY